MKTSLLLMCLVPVLCSCQGWTAQDTNTAVNTAVKAGVEIAGVACKANGSSNGFVDFLCEIVDAMGGSDDPNKMRAPQPGPKPTFTIKVAQADAERFCKESGVKCTGTLPKPAAP